MEITSNPFNDSEFNPFDYTEVSALYDDLILKLFNESGRGAILIVTSHVEDFLIMIIKSNFPENFTKKQQERLLNYPGNLSSFSAKIEVAYAFRIIDLNLYNSINALRKIRNEAAHSNSKFDLVDLNLKMQEVYDLGKGIYSHIKSTSRSLMMEYKMISLKAHFIEKNIELDRQTQILEEILSDKKSLQKIEQQTPHWELLVGTCLICGYIMFQMSRLNRLQGKNIS